MLLGSNKKKFIIFFISNTVLSLILLFLSFYLYSVVMNSFEHGTITWTQNILINIGRAISTYLIAIVFLFPEHIRISFFGSIISYISAFIMTIPITLFIYVLLNKRSRIRS